MNLNPGCSRPPSTTGSTGNLRRRRSTTRLLTVLAGLLVASAHAAPIKGSVHVPGKQDVRGTWITVCDLDAQAHCVEGTQQSQQLTRQDGSSAWFTVEDGPPQPRALVAWKDVNGNGRLDRGDLYGTYSTDGLTPARVRAPYDGAVIWMREQDGVADPFLGGGASAAPNVEARAAALIGNLETQARGDGSTTGTVIVPQGYDVRGVVVLACRFGTDDCYSASQVQLSGRHARWRLDGLADEGHQLVAWADLNGNGEVDGPDLMGTYLNTARDNFGFVRPGLGNITISLTPLSDLATADKPQPKRPPAPDNVFKNTSVRNIAGRWTTQNRVTRLSQGFTTGTVFGGATVQAGWDWTPTQVRQDVDLLIRPDGTFRSVTFTQDFQSESCATLTTVEQVGTVSLSGANLTFNVARRAFREIDTCQPSFNRWGTLPVTREVRLVGLREGPGGAPELVLRAGGPAGDVFFRRS
ncbi:hypothetical protein [Deinococcus sonorensis]|uniref:EF-hand domain-containing protein n=2 Tax=Deinococcus sonorensis TaxID=309891 RepID=A0AAU7U4S9_9DEIO